MNAGKVLIGTALLLLSVALIVAPSRALQPDAHPPVGGRDATGQAAHGTFTPSLGRIVPLFTDEKVGWAKTQILISERSPYQYASRTRT
jgi:hypothetical protein